MERMFKLQCEEKKADDERRREEHRLFQDRLEKLELQRHEHELALRVSARRDKTIDKIVPYQDGTEIEHFVQSLEIELTQSKIPIAEWKRVLTSKLSPKLKHLVADIIDNSDLTYGDLKAKLYRKAGSTTLEVGLKLFTSVPKNVQGKTLRDVVRALYSLSERFYIDCDTKAEMIDRQNCALLRTILLPQQQSMMDARNIKTKEDLMELADSLDAIGVAQKIERFDKPLFSQSQGYGSRGCFKCGKPGHRFFECRARVSMQSQRENNSSPRVVTCFLCGVQGHKSPDCPNKMASGETARVNVKQSMPDKEVNFICAH